MQNIDALTVSQINHLIKNSLENEYQNIAIIGEISNHKLHNTGHQYFSLKDQTGILNAICWKGITLPAIHDGISVMCIGKISSYQSKYHLIIKRLELLGHGNQQLLFNQLKTKLANEGLFDRKRPLPLFPKHIILIVGKDSDAEKDILSRVKERFISKITIIYAFVQGKDAISTIINALHLANTLYNSSQSSISTEITTLQPFISTTITTTITPELIILSRGGGSLEDLAAFNDEQVARAVFANHIPIISAIGHEADIVLTDLVADKRASTPTASVEISLPKTSDLQQSLQSNLTRLLAEMQSTLLINKQLLSNLHNKLQFRIQEFAKYKQTHIPTLNLSLLSKIFTIPMQIPNLLSFYKHKYTQLQMHKIDFQSYLQSKQHLLAKYQQTLHDLSYTSVLTRGFAIVQSNNTIIKHKNDVKPGDILHITLQNSTIIAQVLNNSN